MSSSAEGAQGAIWAALPLPALVLGPGDAIEEANPQAETFLNASARTLRGALIAERLATDAPLPEALARIRADMAPLYLNDVEIGAGGRAPVTCNVQIAPMPEPGAGGRVLMLIAPRELVGRGGPGQAGRSAIGMAAMLCHEIKNPLAGITGAAQLLAMGLGAADRELTDLIVGESRRIVALLEQVEAFGNLPPPRPRAVNLHDVLDRARRSAQVGFGAAMRIVEDYDPSLPAALADPDQLLQVVLNLLRNAAEAQPGGGTVRLRTFYQSSLRLRREGGPPAALPLHVSVEDDGPGIPAAIAADVFEPFVSGREAGTGLGLAIAGRIIAGHGGWIGVESAPGRTAFKISLPLAPKGDD